MASSTLPGGPSAPMANKSLVLTSSPDIISSQPVHGANLNVQVVEQAAANNTEIAAPQAIRVHKIANANQVDAIEEAAAVETEATNDGTDEAGFSGIMPVQGMSYFDTTGSKRAPVVLNKNFKNSRNAELLVGSMVKFDGGFFGVIGGERTKNVVGREELTNEELKASRVGEGSLESLLAGSTPDYIEDSFGVIGGHLEKR